MKLKECDIEVGDLYLTSANQYRAILAMKGDFMIYAPSVEGILPLNFSEEFTKMPFDNQPFKKCQIVTFARKDYQLFSLDGAENNPAIKHILDKSQFTEVVEQCNAASAIATFLCKNT